MNQLHRYHTPARKALDKLLRSTDSYHDWIPEQGPELLYDTGLNRHLGDNGVISPSRVQDINGARIFVASFYHLVGLVAATIKHKFTLICEADYILADYSCPTKSQPESEPRPNSAPKHYMFTLPRLTPSAQ